MISPYSDVHTSNIGEGTNIWQFCVIMKDAIIGERCNICAHVLIENNVSIGNDVTIKSGVQLWDGIILEDLVFVGPNVTFTNDLSPRSKASNWKLSNTNIRRGASIGANSTILPGITIGEFAMIGAGSVVTKDIPPYSLWYGNPAKQRGYVTRRGVVLNMNKVDQDGNSYSLEE